jgi:DNA-binding MarR family transcriptional regulator
MRVRRRNTVLAALELMRSSAPRLTVTELAVLLYVAENPGINIAELAMVARLNMATASRSARSLAGQDQPGALAPYAGLVELMDNPRDGRGRLLKLSPAGLALCAELDGIIEKANPISAAQLFAAA